MGKKHRHKSGETYHFKVSYKKAGAHGAGGTLDYRAGTLREVLKILNESEDINTANTEYLVIHQIMGDGQVKELIGHDIKEGVVSVDFRNQMGSVQPANDGSRYNVPKRVRKQARRYQHYTLGYDEEETIEELERIITEARGEQATEKPAKPRIRLKSAPIVPSIVAGFFYSAQEARPTHVSEV